MNKIKVNDEVVVVAGKDKGKTGKVLSINWKKEVILVKGLNIVKRATKPTQQNPAGGVVEKEAPIHISNVSLMSPKTKKATRVLIKVVDGKKVRVSKVCGSVI